MIGVVGTGTQGAAIAHLAVQADHRVTVTNARGAVGAWPIAAALGPAAHAADLGSTVAAADVVVLAVPFGVYRDFDPHVFTGKTVIDVTNYYPDRDRAVTVSGRPTSLMLQDHLHGATVVKALNNISFPSLRALPRARSARDRSALPLAGNDPAAKRLVASVIDGLGYDFVDAGPLGSRNFEPGTPAYVLPYTIDGDVRKPGTCSRDDLLEFLGVTESRSGR